MQEFSSISVSSYEPGTLADRLNERAGDGWEVVAIVPTGSTVTAYLCRQRRGVSSSPSGSSATDSSVASSQFEPSPVAGVTPAPAASPAESTRDPEPVAAPSEPDTGIRLDTAGMGATPEAIEPVDEPGGWAVTPEPSSTSSSGSASDSSYASSSAISPELPARDTAASDTATTSTADPTPASTAAAAATSDSASASASTGAAAPAGWYADPSSRYELRYWDGSQWTEHVSRAGQQFTDPPVA